MTSDATVIEHIADVLADALIDNSMNIGADTDADVVGAGRVRVTVNGTEYRVTIVREPATAAGVTRKSSALDIAVSEAKRDVALGMVHLPAWDADKLLARIEVLEEAVRARTRERVASDIEATAGQAVWAARVARDGLEGAGSP